MSATTLVHALHGHRDDLAERWRRQLDCNRAAAGRRPVPFEHELAQALFGEVLLMLEAGDGQRIPRRHHACSFSRLAEFPGCVAICIDVFQAGSQVIGAFIVENSGPAAAWDCAARNRFLADLDSVFHILVHREIQALCEMRLQVAPPAGVPFSSTPRHGFGEVPDGTFPRN